MLLFVVLWPMVGAVLTYLIGRKSKRARDLFADAVTVSELVLLLWCGAAVLGGREMTLALPGVCGLGLSFEMDGFRLLYGVIAAFMWMMTTVFSREYFAHYRSRNRYYFFTLVTLGATVGVFLSADLFTTLLFFELLSFTSYAWVAHDEKPASLRAADTYLAVAVIGGLALLMGIFLLQSAVGTLAFDGLLAACRAYPNKGLLYAAGGCLLVGFGAKAGMFPLHIWLPKAHPVAPAPASALLSGMLTKSGVFGVLAVSCNVFLHDAAWGQVVLVLGTVTMFVGALLALFSVDLKRTLACSSMSQIGFILLGIGMQGLLGSANALAVRGTVLHMVNHSLIKLVLFLVAGVVFCNLHRLHLNEIRGFGRGKPVLLLCFLTGALAIGGVPLGSGYVSKTLLHESIVEYAIAVAGTAAHGGIKAVETLFLITGGMTVAYMVKLFVALFVEKNDDQAAMEASGHRYMTKASGFALGGSAVVLAVLGLTPTLSMNRLADLAQGFLHGAAPAEAVRYFSLANLRGAAISLAIGGALYFGFVRTCLMKKTASGRRVYIDRWPRWLDLEELVYRPLLQHALPFVLGFVCRVADKLVDAAAHFVRKTLLREVRPKPPIAYGNYVTHYLGAAMQTVASVLNHTVRRHNPIENRSYQRLTAVRYHELIRTVRLAAKSVSYGLLMFCIGLLITLAYLLSVH